MIKISTVPKTLWLLLIFYITIVTAINIFQYTHFLYTGYDLGIFNQVLWNMIHGKFFAYSFNPYSYLVDHRAWFLLLIAPLYALWPSPLFLLFLQAVALAGGALPLYFLTKKIFKNLPLKKQQAVSYLTIIFYLLNPVVLSMNFFEFHDLALGIPFIFWLWLSLEKKHLKMAGLLSFVLLLIREELALMLMGLGILLLGQALKQKDKKQLYFGLGLIVISALWFVLMMFVGSAVSPEHTAKFFVFYAWLGNTPQAGMQFILLHPFITISHLFVSDHVLVLILLFTTFGFLPMFKPKFLLPALCPLLLYFLIDQSLLSAIFKSHYSASIIPWFFIAALYGLQKIFDWHSPRLKKINQPLLIIFLVWLTTHLILLNPGWGLIQEYKNNLWQNTQEYQLFVAQIKPQDSVLASSAFYPQLSQRENIFPTLHLFSNKEHYSQKPYSPPEKVDWIILEQKELLRYGVFLDFEERENANKRLQSIISKNNLTLVSASEDLAVFGKIQKNPADLFFSTSSSSLKNMVGDTVNNDLYWDSWEYSDKTNHQGQLALAFKKIKTDQKQDDQHLLIKWLNQDQQVLKEKNIALGFGIFPTHTWQNTTDNQIVYLNLKNPENTTYLEVYLGSLKRQKQPLLTLLSDQAMVDLTQAYQIKIPIDQKP